MSLVVPGERLNVVGEPGEGVYFIEGNLYASLVGTVARDEDSGIVSVLPFPENACRSVVPSIDQTIIGKVTKISSKYAAVDIKGIESSVKNIVLPEPFRGTIRSQDVWSEEEREQSIQIPLCFSPGDVVRAKVIGVGDASAGFLLSTNADPRFGVVFARSSASGEPMVPISWNTMVCSKTGTKEKRKCARPDTTSK